MVGSPEAPKTETVFATHSGLFAASVLHDVHPKQQTVLVLRPDLCRLDQHCSVRGQGLLL